MQSSAIRKVKACAAVGKKREIKVYVYCNLLPVGQFFVETVRDIGELPVESS